MRCSNCWTTKRRFMCGGMCGVAIVCVGCIVGHCWGSIYAITRPWGMGSKFLKKRLSAQPNKSKYMVPQGSLAAPNTRLTTHLLRGGLGRRMACRALRPGKWQGPGRDIRHTTGYNTYAVGEGRRQHGKQEKSGDARQSMVDRSGNSMRNLGGGGWVMLHASAPRWRPQTTSYDIRGGSSLLLHSWEVHASTLALGPDHDCKGPCLQIQNSGHVQKVNFRGAQMCM